MLGAGTSVEDWVVAVSLVDQDIVDNRSHALVVEGAIVSDVDAYEGYVRLADGLLEHSTLSRSALLDTPTTAC